MKHVMAVIGTNLYEPVVYYDKEFTSSEQEFVQLALVEKYKKELQEDGAKVTIFATAKAENLNINDRAYSKKEIEEFAPRWVSTRKEAVKETVVKKGLKRQFEEQFPELADRLAIVHIDDAQTEDQIWNVFDTIYKELREGDEIIFDITHSFRSIPMLAMTVINYAKVLKNCTLESMCYGAFEAATVDAEANIKKAPLNDLTMYDEILSWSNAANVFARYGNASMMKELFEMKREKVPNDQKKEWSGIRTIMDDVEILSDAIQTSRGVDGTKLKKKGKARAKVSVKYAYEVFAADLKKNGEGKAKEIKPLVPLLKKVEKDFSVFDCQENYEVGLGVVSWAVKNGMVQQGYTALEETMKTYICWRYGLDQMAEEDRDDLPGTVLYWLKDACTEGKTSLETAEDRIEFLKNKLSEDTPFAENLNRKPEKKQAIFRMFEDDNRELALLLYSTKDKRNDINHFGMRENPSESSQLRKNLENDYIKFIAIIGETEKEEVYE